MKPYFVIIFILGSFLILACAEKEDPCDVDHIIVNDECVPTYIFPDPNSVTLKNGDTFYHKVYGIITYTNGHWINDKNQIIEELEIKINL